jgi:hypothetical protein
VGAATPEYMYELLFAYARNVKVVVVALDFFMFNEALFPYATDDQLGELRSHFASDHTRISLFEALLADPSYLLSLHAAIKLFERRPSGTSKRWTMPRGNWNIADWEEQASKDRAAGPHKINRDPYDKQLNVLRTGHYSNYVFSERRVRVLQQIRTLMAQRHIKLLVQINPVNIEDRELLERMNLKSMFERYREAVKSVFPDAEDFSGPQYEDRSHWFSFDPIHFTTEFAASLVNQQLEKIVSMDERNEIRGPERLTVAPSSCE